MKLRLERRIDYLGTRRTDDVREVGSLTWTKEDLAEEANT